jgi:D-glycero-D-manno-heptose 1,7-bisphosphate phosphatase
MKLVILDRDGVINEDSDDYIKSVEEWQPIAGSLEAIAQLSQAGFTVAIASNQSGIGRGLFDYEALFAIHARLQRAVADLGGRIDLIEFCPETPENASIMRKPGPGMLFDIAKRMQTSLDGVPFVGDTLSDVQAARAAGARPIVVLSGKGSRIKMDQSIKDVDIFQDLAAFATNWIVRTTTVHS